MSSPRPSVVSTLERNAQTNPNRPAFIFVDEHLDRLVLTRQQVWDYSRKFAAVLRRKRLGKGDVVCNTLRNSPQRVITDFGVVTAGAIAMNGQLCYADGHDFLFSLNQGKATVVILDPQVNKGAFAILKPRLEHYDPETGEVSCPEVPSLKFIMAYSLRRERGSGNSFLESLDMEKDLVHEEISPEDVCYYMCTSGTTNIFKLVAVNSHVLMEFGRAFAQAAGAKSEDNLQNNRPLGWLGGYPTIHLVLGTCRVIFNESNGIPANFNECQWNIICREKCDLCYASPLSLIDLNTAREKSEDAEVRNYRLRHIMSGGGPVTMHHLLASLGKLTGQMRVIYASTESGVVSCLPVDKLEDFEEYKTGKTMPGIKVKVVDRSGNEVPVGQKGEILIQSTQQALYYVNDPKSTAATFQSDGWIRLGDIGFLNSQGQLSVVGREKFAILKGPIIIYPYTVEAAIRKCPGVKEAFVCGVPDKLLNEELCAMVTRKPEEGRDLTAEDIKDHCQGCLADTDIVSIVPRYVLFVEEFPTSMTGKMDRLAARRKACKMLDLHSSDVANVDEI